MATICDNYEMVMYLLEKGAVPSIKTQSNDTILSCLVSNHNLDITKALIEYGADVKEKDRDDTTLLFYAL